MRKRLDKGPEIEESRFDSRQVKEISLFAYVSRQALGRMGRLFNG
jgi:hypothetical protein